MMTIIQKLSISMLVVSFWLLPGKGVCQINVVSMESQIKLDGLLNEAVWERVEPLTDFTQQELTEGAPPTEKTEMRFLHDKDNLYIGIICYDSEPDKIIHKQMKQDEDPGSDDRISFIIDTYFDKRTGFLFPAHRTFTRTSDYALIGRCKICFLKVGTALIYNN